MERNGAPDGYDVPGFDRENDFAALTRYEVADRLEERGLVVIPTGSVEQHGPHLPVGTDTYAVRAIAKRVAARLDGLYVPFSAFGVTPFHADVPGAVDLAAETLMALFEDVCGSLVEHGADAVVVVNWHEGNTAALETAAGRLQRDHRDVRFVFSHANYAAQERYGDRHDLTHGGPLEVLPVLGTRPDLVHLDRATDPSDEDHAATMDDLRRNRRAYPVVPDVRIMYPTGWYGDLDVVDDIDPEAFLERVAADCAADVAEVLDVLADLEYRVDEGDDHPSTSESG